MTLIRKKRSGKLLADINEVSPLRKADPRVKLVLSLCASLAVMLSIKELFAAFTIYLAFLGWARLLPSGLKQLWNIKWVLLFLFLGDWILVSLDLAMLITLRISLLSLAFNMFFSTTTTTELCLALVWFRVPFRYAFSIGLSFQSIGAIDAEWRSILEAQKSRGAAGRQETLFRSIYNTVHNLVSLTVPAVVLTTRRAWSMAEAASARGFDSPKRRSYYRLSMSLTDLALIFAAVSAIILIKFWKYII